MVLVRVILPTFNRAALLENALRAVLNQTFGDFEVIIADDGSTDETSALATRWGDTDPRIRYLQLTHGGAAAARNAALGADGGFVYAAFLDSDDCWHPEHLHRATTVLEHHNDVDVTFGVFETLDESGTWTAAALQARSQRAREPLTCVIRDLELGAHLLDAERLERAFLRSTFIPHTSTVVVRASAILSKPWFDTSYEIFEDCLFFLKTAAAGHRFAFFDKLCCSVRYHGANLTGGNVDLGSPVTLRRQAAVLRYCQTSRQYCRTRADRRIVGTSIANQAYLVGQCYAEQLDFDSARKCFRLSLARPSVRTFKSFLLASLPAALQLRLRRPRGKPS